MTLDEKEQLVDMITITAEVMGQELKPGDYDDGQRSHGVRLPHGRPRARPLPAPTVGSCPESDPRHHRPGRQIADRR